ncbi:hypothetical protein NEOLEDRAFT_1170858 [Neolentinus lepideus HHB14362 ss-1]|uniref:F-box domain-containing protein n=1 Tax=Neolentinus lepideus HHB14362 ss-1 TaxID=1314782 RepID=A0A165R6I1_9AGAM|nr:hypothetical protein NEOLEDRAFT_1170858 [Neolentinus lepideus HHB14362 ss-1]
MLADLPPELLDRIVMLSSFDDCGRTLAVLRLVSRYVSAIAEQYRFHCMVVLGPDNINMLLRAIRHATPRAKDGCRHLIISDASRRILEIYKRTSHTTTRRGYLWSGFPMKLMKDVMYSLLELVAPTLQTLALLIYGDFVCLLPRTITVSHFSEPTEISLNILLRLPSLSSLTISIPINSPVESIIFFVRNLDAPSLTTIRLYHLPKISSSLAVVRWIFGLGVILDWPSPKPLRLVPSVEQIIIQFTPTDREEPNRFMEALEEAVHVAETNHRRLIILPDVSIEDSSRGARMIIASRYEWMLHHGQHAFLSLLSRLPYGSFFLPALGLLIRCRRIIFLLLHVLLHALSSPHPTIFSVSPRSRQRQAWARAPTSQPPASLLFIRDSHTVPAVHMNHIHHMSHLREHSLGMNRLRDRDAVKVPGYDHRGRIGRTGALDERRAHHLLPLRLLDGGAIVPEVNVEDVDVFLSDS